MHLVIPHASALGDACAHTLGTLALPRLSRLLAVLKPQGAPVGGDEFSPSTPFEQLLAGLRGPQADTGAMLLTPIHMSIGSDQATAVPLALEAGESRAFFDSLHELWDGHEAQWLAPLQWRARHDSFIGQDSASADRVLGRGVEPWLPTSRALRRFQNEAQMMLHGHPLNEAREARGALPLNSLWISPWPGELPAGLTVDERLREPLLAGDWAAWAEAWRALDAALPDGEFTLTLCGERSAQTYAPAPRGFFARLLGPARADAAKILEAL